MDALDEPLLKAKEEANKESKEHELAVFKMEKEFAARKEQI
jgi:hypothetical protein